MNPVDNPEGFAAFTIVLTLAIIAVSFLATGLVIYFVWKKVLGPMLKNQSDAQALLRTGVPAQARVMALHDTGVTVNDNPQVQIALEVFPPNGQPSYQAQCQTLISRLAIPRFQPGCTVQVRVDPQNPARVAVVPS